jgi:ATP-dependent DNA helicase DinG
MIAEVSKVLARDGFDTKPAIGVIEAGTGTGKTIAYTIAAVPIARARDKRLVISTATVALQEQLIYQDLPDIARLSGLEFSVALAKGRRRYVCLAKLDQALNQSSGPETIPLYPDEYEWLGDAGRSEYEHCMSLLAQGAWDGDRDSLDLALEDRQWFPITSDHAQCTGRRCAYIGQCSFYKAREQLADADVIVTNHDLVLSDLSIGGGVVLPAPEDVLYVFDEGHHLAEKAKNHCTAFCHLQSTTQWSVDTRDWLKQAQTFFDDNKLDSFVPKLSEHLSGIESCLQEAVGCAMELRTDDDFGPVRELRFAHGAVPETLRDIFYRCSLLGGKAQGLVERMIIQCEDLLDTDDADKDTVDRYLSACQTMSSRLDSLQVLWLDFGRSEISDPPPARWLKFGTANGQETISCHSSPTLATDFLNTHLWDRAAGVLITSASLTALGRFDRFVLHAGTPSDATYLVVSSPFDYSRGTLHVPAHLPEANKVEAHTEALTAELPEMLKIAKGTLVLFASRRQMLDVYEGLSELDQAEILMQDQQSKKTLLDEHRARIDRDKKSVIFGLASFAEGVDLPASYCEHVIIAKIPFSVPDDPREAALSEWIEKRGGNAFREISVPDAGARLLQACGRLLRTEQDQGRITILDTRLLTKNYGRQLLDSLPPFTRVLQ